MFHSSPTQDPFQTVSSPSRTRVGPSTRGRSLQYIFTVLRKIAQRSRTNSAPLGHATGGLVSELNHLGDLASMIPGLATAIPPPKPTTGGVYMQMVGPDSRVPLFQSDLSLCIRPPPPSRLKPVWLAYQAPALMHTQMSSLGPSMCAWATGSA